MTDQSTGLKTWRAPSCTHHTCRFVHVLEDYSLLMVEGGCPLYRKRTVYIYVLLGKVVCFPHVFWYTGGCPLKEI